MDPAKMTNEQKQANGLAYVRVIDLTPDQYEDRVRRAVYRGSSTGVVVALVAMTMVWVMLGMMLSAFR